jgi:hypothetical protein
MPARLANREINAALADPKIKARLADMGWCLRSRLATSAKFIADEAESGAR